MARRSVSTRVAGDAALSTAIRSARPMGMPSRAANDNVAAPGTPGAMRRRAALAGAALLGLAALGLWLLN